MSFFEKIRGNSGRIQTSLSTIVKIILIVSIFYTTYNHLWHILFADIFLLILLYIPAILKQNYHVHIPKEFEFLFLLFVIVTFFIGDIRGFILQVFFGISVGFIGFTIMLILFSNSKFKTNYLLTMLFAFSISVTFGLTAEMLKYYLKILLNYPNVLEDYPHTMLNLTLVAVGAFFSSVIGYFYMKGYRLSILNYLVSKFKNKNPNLFLENIDTPDDLLKIIDKGEGNKLEFKSTLRTNIHTGEHDKKMEIEVLKTVVSFMNSEGGLLLIGVNDKGEISGIEKDKFESLDRFQLSLTNLIKEKIGKEYLPFMKFDFIEIDGKNIMKVECKHSNRPVFLKHEGIEHFFARVGASTVEVSGSKLVDYIGNRFK